MFNDTQHTTFQVSYHHASHSEVSANVSFVCISFLDLLLTLIFDTQVHRLYTLQDLSHHDCGLWWLRVSRLSSSSGFPIDSWRTCSVQRTCSVTQEIQVLQEGPLDSRNQCSSAKPNDCTLSLQQPPLRLYYIKTARVALKKRLWRKKHQLEWLLTLRLLWYLKCLMSTRSNDTSYSRIITPWLLLVHRVFSPRNCSKNGRHEVWKTVSEEKRQVKAHTQTHTHMF